MSVTVDQSVKEWYEDQAERKNVSTSECVNDTLNTYIEHRFGDMTIEKAQANLRDTIGILESVQGESSQGDGSKSSNDRGMESSGLEE